MRLPLVPFLGLAVGCALASCSRPAPASSTAAERKSVPAPPTAGAAASAPATASFTFATQTLTVPAGFTVEQVAAPPMVNRPISIAFDEQGRLYATDSSGLSDRAPVQFEQKPHRIVRLEDADGDGRFETSTVFAENMMFPQGALFHEGSLYVAAPPHIWKITDVDGDGVSDKREVWWDGKTLTGCANDVHGPYLGPDGWFYWTKGAFAEQRHTLWNGKPFVTRAAHIYRARPDGSRFEPVLTGGMDNPVGVTFSATGERFLSGTFFQVGVAGKRDGLIHAIYGGVYGKENAASAGHARTGDLMPIMTHMGAAAPCGSMTYRSRVFGDEFQDNLFVCYFNLRKISRHQLVPDGASFRTIDSDFVTSDSQDFRPTDVLEDADGSLLVVDTGAWYKICCPTSQLSKPDILGGIYRVRKTGAPKSADPRGLKLDWAKLDAEAAARLLAHGSPYIEERAMHLLGQQGATAVPALAAILAQPAATPAARRNALWTLARIDAAPARNAARAALNDADASVVHAAIQVISLWRDPESVAALGQLVSSSKPMLARLAAEALGRIGRATAVDALIRGAQQLANSSAFTNTGAPENSAERALEHALIYALIELGQRQPLLAHLNPGAQPRVVRTALVALGGIPGGLQPQEVLPFLDSPTPRLKQTAAWVVSQHPDWGGALADYFRSRLQKPFRDDTERADLQTQVAQLARAAEIQQLLAGVATDARSASASRALALRAMAAAGLRETPALWLDAIAKVLAGAEVVLVRDAVTAARALPPPRNGHAELAAALARAGRDSRVPADVRLDALAATTPAAMAAIEPGLFDFLCAHLDGRQPVMARAAAASALAKAPLTPEQQLALAETMKSVTPLEAPKLLPAFEKKPNEALGLKLVGSLQQSKGLAGLRPNLLKPVFARYPKPVQDEADVLIARLNSDATRQNARVDELLAGVKDGDIRRGQAVYNSQKAACTLCHVVGHGGGRYGPDLTNIGRIRNERELLEAVVFPSATFVRGFEPFVVTVKAGEAHTGIIRKDSPEEVVLASGPDSERRIARGDIADMQPGTVSPMPPGMDAVLTKQEIADLVAFLKSRQ